MKKLAVLLLAALPLFADVIIPENEKKPRPTPPPTDTTASTSTATTTTAPAPTPPAESKPVAPASAVASSSRWIVWTSVIGIALIVLVAARRKARPVQ